MTENTDNNMENHLTDLASDKEQLNEDNEAATTATAGLIVGGDAAAEEENKANYEEEDPEAPTKDNDNDSLLTNGNRGFREPLKLAPITWTETLHLDQVSSEAPLTPTSRPLPPACSQKAPTPW